LASGIDDVEVAAMTKTANPGRVRRSRRRGGVTAVLKWVGGGTAVLSLVFGLRQLTTIISDARRRQHQVIELIGMGKLQQESRDYGAAWTSLAKAAELRANDPRVRSGQEDLAMAWLDDIRGSQEPTPFTAIVDRLVPVLSRGVVAANGPRKADLLAHLGWADFLRWRDGQRSLDPAAWYRQALAADSQNVYAHAMLAHWTLWNDGKLEDTNGHFASALKSGRERSYVRRLQLAALANTSDGAGEVELLRETGFGTSTTRASSPIQGRTRSNGCSPPSRLPSRRPPVAGCSTLPGTGSRRASCTCTFWVGSKRRRARRRRRLLPTDRYDQSCPRTTPAGSAGESIRQSCDSAGDHEVIG
jgi:hypothetical protein